MPDPQQDSLVHKRRNSKRRAVQGSSSGPRLLAASVLSEWFSAEPGRRIPLKDLSDAHVKKTGIKGKDLSLFWEIVFGTVRWKRLLEWHLKKHLKRMARLPLPVQMILLTGSYQIIFLSRIPSFAAVDEAVKAAKKMGFSWARGLINAVLRKISSSTKVIPEDEKFFAENCSGKFLNCLSVFSSHPHWMVKRWDKHLGRNKAVYVCLQNNRHPQVTIRVNTLKISREALKSLLSEQGISTVPGQFSQDALILKDFRGKVENLPGFSRGFFQVQDEASQMISNMLAVEPGMTVLDMCAGVGGKSTHVAALMKNSGRVICTDTSRKRLELLSQNAQRLGIKNIKIRFPGSSFNREHAGCFDRILVDAPCSGTGVIRRHPDIKWNRTPEMLTEFQKVQDKLLKDAEGLLRPWGVLVYSVCSLEPEEGPSILLNFLRDCKSFSILNASKLLPAEAGRITSPEGFLSILPGQYGMDGFFAGALVNKAGTEES